MTTDLEVPVTRREFIEELDKISNKIDELFKAKQVNWQFVGMIIALVGGAIGFGIKNWGDVGSLREASISHSATLETLMATVPTLATIDARSKDNALTVADLRERTRGLESNTRAIMIEGETQNRWMADTVNMESMLSEQRLSAYCAHCDSEHRASRIVFPERRYWPMSKIGDANPMNGSH